LRTDEERDNLAKVINWEYQHSKVLDGSFLSSIDLDSDIENAFKYVV